MKNISSALQFEFDANSPEIVILEDLVLLASHERWLYGLLEEARKYHKLIVATTTKLDALDSLEKRIRSRFASSGKFQRRFFRRVQTSIQFKGFLCGQLHIILKPGNVKIGEHSIFFQLLTKICLMRHRKLCFY